VNLLFLTLVFPPDGVSTAHIMGDLTEDLARGGHAVSVFTTTPHFNRDPDAEGRQPRRHLWPVALQRSDFRGIPVYHTLMPRKGRSVALRLAGWAWFHAIATLAAVLITRRPDVIVVPSPPLTMAVSAWLVGLCRRAPFIYNVQEIYPDIAINLGALRNPLLIGALRRLERFAYRKAGAVTVIAPRMRDRLLERGVPADKVHVIPNFVNLDDLPRVAKDNPFSREHDLHEKFVVSYAGNLGPAQGLEAVLSAAELLREHGSIRFLLVGDGILGEALRQQRDERRLDNCVIVPYQPFARVPEIYGASDVCLVPQARETGSDAIPSKVYRIMACSKPVIGVTERDSDLAGLIHDAGCGAVVEAGNPEALAAVVLDASRDPLAWRQFGEAGRMHVSARYTRAVVSRQYSDLLARVAAIPAARNHA